MSKSLRVMRMVMSGLGFALLPCVVSSVRSEEQAPQKLPAGYVEEAPLPEGFPPPGPVGEVIEKQYPTTRSYSAAGDGAFMDCFGYLAAHHFRMTAPVVVEYKPGAEKSNGQARSGMPIPIERMHFLLEKNSLDEPKEAGAVKVADMPKLRVLSIAQRGPITTEAIKAAQDKLNAKIRELSKIRPAGEFRILGYNSPMSPREKNFWEVQLPIEENKP